MSEANVSRNHPTLWAWPDRARFGRAVPKSKFYEHGEVTTRVRESFVTQVAQITWTHKLAPGTIGLPATQAVPEIEVLEVALKPGIADVSEDVLATLSRAIPAPVVVEIRDDGRLRFAAAPTKGRDAAFVTTDWIAASALRTPLPPALDLAGLHTALVAPLLPHALRPGESLTEAAERSAAARRLEREIAALERRVRAEKQFNRRAGLARTLRERRAALTTLTTPTAEDR